MRANSADPYNGPSVMAEKSRPRLVGLNHIALEVGDVEAALAFYGKIFTFELRGRGAGQAFIDMGDQFIALMETDARHSDRHRHFGLVVDDRSRVRELARSAGATLLEGNFLDFLDPWGNRIEVVEYGDVQFSKAPGVLRGMKLADLAKSNDARKQLAHKGMN
jgi:catechol 2,3-dioxygenase-like lactoylglutathione lyase family enzyme